MLDPGFIEYFTKMVKHELNTVGYTLSLAISLQSIYYVDFLTKLMPETVWIFPGMNRSTQYRFNEAAHTQIHVQYTAIAKYITGTA